MRWFRYQWVTCAILIVGSRTGHVSDQLGWLQLREWAGEGSGAECWGLGRRIGVVGPEEHVEGI